MRPFALALIALTALAAPAVAQPRYTLTDLGALTGATGADAHGINNRGVVVGSSTVNDRRHAFIYYDGTMHDLGTFGLDEADANSINDVGQVTISTIDRSNPSDADGVGYLYDHRDGTSRALPTLGGRWGYGTDVNASGQMSGTSRYPGPYNFGAARYDDNGRQITNLGALGGDRASALGINDAGHVVGYARTGTFRGNTPVHHAFVHRGAAMTDLGTLGGDFSIAFDVNNRGQVVGMANTTTTSTTRWHAFLHEDGVMRDLGTLMINSYAHALNESGEVVGYMSDSLQSNERAFVYTGGRLYDLNSVADLPAGWMLRQAIEINDLGQIVGWGTSATGRHTAFVLTPVPEPASFLVAAGAALIALRRTRRREQP